MDILSVERKLVALRKRLVDTQRGLLLQAAETETVPTYNALRQIADLESVIMATETMIEEQVPRSSDRFAHWSAFRSKRRIDLNAPRRLI